MDQNQHDQTQNGKVCACPHHKMVPIFIILLGLVFLLENLGALSASIAGLAWPIIVILIGAQKIFGGRCKCC